MPLPQPLAKSIMKKIIKQITFLTIVVLLVAWSEPSDVILSAGLQPQITLDNSENVRIVYGRADSIFCLTSINKGETFSKPVLVGRINGMHLGMTRGPQLASSSKYSVISGIDTLGNIHFFQLTHSTNQWEYKGRINDVPSSAPEGLMSITADTKDNFYAVWLDLRQNRRNNICFSSLSGETGKWKKNELIYISPDGHVCECCKPSIDVNGANVAVMYRNWLNGSRDLYVIKSQNAGKSFQEAQKLGLDTWKLVACPMDGGDIKVDNDGKVQTVWRREGLVYYCQPKEREINIAKGKSCSIVSDNTNNKGLVIAMQEGENVKLVGQNNQNEINVGKGKFLKSAVLNNKEVLCVWEHNKSIRYRKIPTSSANTALIKEWLRY